MNIDFGKTIGESTISPDVEKPAPHMISLAFPKDTINDNSANMLKESIILSSVQSNENVIIQEPAEMQNQQLMPHPLAYQNSTYTFSDSNIAYSHKKGLNIV